MDLVGGAGRIKARLRANERLLMITVSTMLVMAGQGVIAPVLPLFAQGLSVSVAAVGLALGIFGFARLVLNVPIGLISDRYGRRLVLIGGPLVTALGMAWSGLAPDLPQLLAARFVAGAGSAMYMTGAQLYLVDISTPANRARFIATNQGAILTGVAIGPGIGGLLADAFGLRMPFYVVAVGALVAGVYAFWRIPETNHPHHAASGGAVRPAPWAWLRFVLSTSFLSVALVTMAIFGTRLGARATLMPLVGVDRFDMSPAVLGGVFTAIAITGLLLIGPSAWIADRFGRKVAIVPSGFVAAGGMVLMAVSTRPWMLVAGIVVTAIGTGIAGPAPAAYAGDIAPAELRGLAMGMYRSAGDVGFVAAPALLGLLADHTSLGWALVANGALVAFASLVFAIGAHETAGPRRRIESVTETPATETAQP